MAAAQKTSIQLQPTVNGGGWTAVLCPIRECRRLTIKNPDLASDLFISTNTADALSLDTIPAGTTYTMDLSGSTREGRYQTFTNGEAVCWLKGAGSSPVVLFER